MTIDHLITYFRILKPKKKHVRLTKFNFNVYAEINHATHYVSLVYIHTHISLYIYIYIYIYIHMNINSCMCIK